jgi:hypothetical protein
MEEIRKKIAVVGTILAVDIVALVLFAGILRWI